MVFQKILVALDRSPNAPTVFEEGLHLAHKQGSQLMLFYCLNWEKEEKSSPFLGLGTLADVNLYGTLQKLRQESLEQDLEQVRDWLQDFCRESTSRGVQAQLDCRVGSPSQWICDRAENWGADLIVLGRRGHRGLSELLLGSVSNYVVHHAPCSVLVVKGMTQ